jgi:hypothetical protein
MRSIGLWLLLGLMALPVDYSFVHLWPAPFLSAPVPHRPIISPIHASVSTTSTSYVLPALSNFTLPNFGDQAFDLVSGFAEAVVRQAYRNQTQRNLPIAQALLKIEQNMDLLDNVAGRTPQLTRLELLILGTSVILSTTSPLFFSSKVNNNLKLHRNRQCIISFHVLLIYSDSRGISANVGSNSCEHRIVRGVCGQSCSIE